MVRPMILGFVGFRDSFTFRERAPRICGVFGQAVPSPAEQNFYEDRKAAKYPNAHLYVRSWSGPAASDNRRSSLEDTLWGSSKASPTTSRPPRPRTRSRSKSARLYAVHYWNDSTLAIHCCGDDEREQTHKCDSRTRYVRILVWFSSRDRFAPNEKKPEPKRSRLSSSIQNLLTGCVKSQYTACIPMSPSNATNVNQEPVLPKGVRNNRMIVEIVPPAAPMPPPMVNPG
jgi:hypothetical protein